MGHGHVREERVPGNHRNRRDFPKAAVDCFTAAVIADFEKGRVLERVGRSNRDLETRDVIQGGRKGGAELVESLYRELIGPGCCPADKADLLDHDVQKVIGMQADFAGTVQGGSELVQFGLESVGRDPDQTAGKSPLVCAPDLVVMPTVSQRRIACERLPKSSIGAVSPTSASTVP